MQLTPSSTHLLPSLNPSPYEHWLPSSVYPSIVAVYILQDSVPSANFRPSYFSVIREAIIREKKDFLWNHFVNGGGLTDFIPLFYFSKHPPNTLQTPCNTLQAPLKHPSTPFKQPSKSSFFSIKKWSEKKINRDFIKGGRGGGHHFMKWFHKKSFFFTIDGFPKYNQYISG